MHMLFRFIILFLKKRWLPKSEFDETTEISMRVLPTDLDFLWHVNNGVYFSFMDFGRMDMIYRNGVFQLSQREGWYGVVAGETIKFKRSLKLFDKFTIQTKVLGHDERYFFISQKFMCQGQLMASGLVKIRFLSKKGGSVPIAEILSHFKSTPSVEAADLGQEWYGMESKYLA
jgi:acyl-CoA thioesterase FadM